MAKIPARYGAGSIYTPSPLAAVGSGPKSHDRTPAETINDSYMAVVKASSLNAIALMAMKSMDDVNQVRADIASRHPELEVLLQGLLVNHAVQLAEVQRSIVADKKVS